MIIHLTEREIFVLIAALTGQAVDGPHSGPAIRVSGWAGRVPFVAHSRVKTDGDGDGNVALGELLWAAVCLRGHVQDAFTDLDTLSGLRGPTG